MKMFYIFAIILFINNIYATEITSAKEIKEFIKASCQKKLPVMVLFMTEKEMLINSEMDNELYGDWAYNINESIEKIHPEIKVISTSIDVGNQLFKSSKKPDNAYSMLFIPCNRKSLYAKDAIVESFVYKYMKLYFDKKDKGITLSNLYGMNSMEGDKFVTLESLGLEELEIE